jgi:AcrR family transcriptional regulator
VILASFGALTDMPRDKTLSHEKIIRAARDEFSEYGYDKASMRRIGSRCGLTAAALYRHFDSKEDMFDALVGPALEDLKVWINEHVSRSEEAIRACTEIPDNKSTKAIWDSTEIDMMRELIYPRMEEYSMLINRSHGSKYENFLNDLVEDQLKRMMPQLKELKKLGLDVKDISEEELHMVTTAYCTALFEPVVHNYSLEDAVRYLETVEAFFMPGWKNLMGFA